MNSWGLDGRDSAPSQFEPQGGFLDDVWQARDGVSGDGLLNTKVK